MSWARQTKTAQALVIAHLGAGKAVADHAVVTAFGEAIKMLSSAAEVIKGYPKVFAEQIVIVEGTGRFPLEQLARDWATPRTESDALMIYRENPPAAAHVTRFRRVELRRFVSTGRAVPYVARWESFGWSVRWWGPPDEYHQAHHKLDRDDAAVGRVPAARP